MSTNNAATSGVATNAATATNADFAKIATNAPNGIFLSMALTNLDAATSVGFLFGTDNGGNYLGVVTGKLAFMPGSASAGKYQGDITGAAATAATATNAPNGTPLTNLSLALLETSRLTNNAVNTNAIYFNTAATNIFGVNGALSFAWSAAAHAYTNGHGEGFAYFSSIGDIAVTNATFPTPDSPFAGMSSFAPGFVRTGFNDSDYNDWPTVATVFGTNQVFIGVVTNTVSTPGLIFPPETGRATNVPTLSYFAPTNQATLPNQSSWEGFPILAAHPNGKDIYVVYSSGSSECDNANALLESVSHDGGSSWSAPWTIASGDSTFAVVNQNFGIRSDGVQIIFYSSQTNCTWNQGPLTVKASVDNGLTWTSISTDLLASLSVSNLAGPAQIFSRNHSLYTAVYSYTNGSSLAGYALVSADGGTNWSKYTISSSSGGIEPQLLPVNDNFWLAAGHNFFFYSTNACVSWVALGNVNANLPDTVETPFGWVLAPSAAGPLVEAFYCSRSTNIFFAGDNPPYSEPLWSCVSPLSTVATAYNDKRYVWSVIASISHTNQNVGGNGYSSSVLLSGNDVLTAWGYVTDGTHSSIKFIHSYPPVYGDFTGSGVGLTFTNAAGAKFSLIVNSATNGFNFVPQ